LNLTVARLVNCRWSVSLPKGSHKIDEVAWLFSSSPRLFIAGSARLPEFYDQDHRQSLTALPFTVGSAFSRQWDMWEATNLSDLMITRAWLPLIKSLF